MGVEEAKCITYPDQYYPIYWRGADGRKWIRRGDIASYFDETFFTAVEVWNKFKLFGLPHGSGWLNERPSVVAAVSVVESERTFYESRKLEEARKKRGSS